MKKKNFFARHKVAVIITLVVLIAAAVITATYFQKKKRAEMLASTAEPLATGEVTRQTISNYVSMTGKISAKDSQTVYSAINGVEVLAVNVDVGDVVAVLDSSDFEDKLATAREDLEIQRAKTALEVEKAQKEYDQALEDTARDAEAKYRAVQEAGRDYGYNEGDKDDAYSDWQDAIEDYEDAKKDYEKANKKYKKLKKNKDSVVYNGTTYYYDSDDSSSASSGNFDEKDRTDLKTIVEQLEDKMDSAEKAANTAQRQYQNAVEGLEKQNRQYEDSLDEKENKEKDNARSIEKASEALYSAKLDAENSTSQLKNQIREYEKNIEKCTVKAPLSGVVTSVKMEVGDETDGDKNVICVINDTSSYKVEGTVDEYDIAKLSEGMSTVIKTESTGDLEMKGKVTFVSPTPESSSSTTGTQTSSSVAYPIEILIDKLEEDVRIGMTAETNILTETAEDVLTVPYDCITQNLDGDYVVYAVKEGAVDEAAQETESGESEKSGGGPFGGGMRGPGGPPGRGGFGSSDDEDIDISRIKRLGQEIVVEKLLETDYYTAVSGEGLSEGMKVYVVTTASDDDDEDEDEEGPMMP